jgi:hypothetical protein
MGATIWLEVNDGSSEDPADNSMLLEFESQLSALAEQLKVRPLRSFYDYGALAEDAADEFGDEVGEAGAGPAGSTNQWFDSSEGLATFQALGEALRARPQARGFNLRRGQEHWSSMLAEELAYCESRLKEAVAYSHSFRLRIVS